MTLESLLYLLIGIVAVGMVCDVIVLIVAVQMRQEARRDRKAAGKLVDMAAQHGKTTDNQIERAVADMKSGVRPPVPRANGPRGCGALVAAGGAVALGCALEGHADAADAMRHEGEVRAAEWWAGQQGGTPR